MKLLSICDLQEENREVYFGETHGPTGPNVFSTIFKSEYGGYIDGENWIADTLDLTKDNRIWTHPYIEEVYGSYPKSIPSDFVSSMICRLSLSAVVIPLGYIHYDTDPRVADDLHHLYKWAANDVSFDWDTLIGSDRPK